MVDINDIRLSTNLQNFLIMKGILTKFLIKSSYNKYTYIHVTNISDGFSWDNSSEGFKYWNNLSIAYYEYVDSL